MTVTTTARVTVDIAKFQQAIRSVVVHSEKQKVGDEQALTCRVRFEVTEVDLTVSATDGRSTARAWVPLERGGPRLDAPTDGPLFVDLMPKQARQLAAAVTPLTVDGESHGDAEFRVDYELETVTITDLSGLYPNTSTRVPILQQEATDTLPGTDHLGYPDIRRILGEAFTHGPGHVRVMLPPGRVLARFETAAGQYGRPLVVEQVGDPDASAWLVTCGTLFAGMMVDRAESEDDARFRAAARIGFLRRLSKLDPADAARLDLGVTAAELVAEQADEEMSGRLLDNRGTPVTPFDDQLLNRPFRVVTPLGDVQDT